MPLKDIPNTVQQPVSEGATTPSDVVVLPALQAQFTGTALGETLRSYRQKAAERPPDPYGRSADS